MSISPTNNPYDGAQVVSRLIGTAFETVKNVSDNLPTVKHVSFYMEDIWKVSNDIDNIINVSTHISDIQNIFPYVTALTTVSTNINQINAVYNELDVITALPGQITEVNAKIDTVENLVDEFGDVATAIAGAQAAQNAAAASATAASSSATNAANSRDTATTAAGNAVIAQTAAEAAAEAAQSAADSVNGTTAIALTRTAAQAMTPVTAPTFIQVLGYNTIFDDGGAYYKAVASQPANGPKFSITLQDGVTVQWYGFVGATLTPEQCGAKCSAAFDDQPAMQAALNSGWLDIRLTPGKTYYPRSNLSITVDNLKFTSDGTATIFMDKQYFNNNNPYIAGDARIAQVNAGPGGWSLNSTGRFGSNAIGIVIGHQSSGGVRRANIRMSGIKFLGNNPSGLAQYPVELRNLSDCEIDHCEFTGFGMGIMIGIYGCWNTQIHHNYIHDCLESGIYPAVSAGDAADSAPNVTAIGSMNDFAAYHGVSKGTHIYENHIKNIHFTGAGLARHTDQSDGINLAEMSGLTYFNIHDNYIESVAEGCDIFECYGKVHNNHLFGCNIFGLKFIYGASYNTIDSNTIIAAGAAGIVCQGSTGFDCHDNTGSNNVIYNMSIVDYPDNSCIQLSASGTGSVYGNQFLDGVYNPSGGNTVCRNTAQVGSNPNNIITGKLTAGSATDVKQRYCSQGWAGLTMKPSVKSRVTANLNGVGQNVAASNAATILNLVDTTGIDTLGEWDNTAHTFVPLFPGVYEIQANMRISGSMTSGEGATLGIILPSGTAKIQEGKAAADGTCMLAITGIFNLTPVIGGTSDTVQIAATSAHSSVVPLTTGAGYCSVQISRLD
jgi:hypothetical protein